MNYAEWLAWQRAQLQGAQTVSDTEDTTLDLLTVAKFAEAQARIRTEARAEALEEAAQFVKAINDAEWGVALNTIDYLVDGIRALKERKS